MRQSILIVVLGVGFILAGSPRAWAQAAQLDDGPAPPPGATAPAVAVSEPTATPAPPAEPVWDPLRASKSMEVGAYYLKTGNYNAAIDRFEEAARVQPGLARPFLMLGKTYEKKRDPKSAVTAYQKYLQLYPTAPERADVLKLIAKLSSGIPKQTTQSSSR